MSMEQLRTCLHLVRQVGCEDCDRFAHLLQTREGLWNRVFNAHSIGETRDQTKAAIREAVEALIASREAQYEALVKAAGAYIATLETELECAQEGIEPAWEEGDRLHTRHEAYLAALKRSSTRG